MPYAGHPWTIAALMVLLLVLPARAEPPLPEVVEFNRDIRPILSDACFACHGPDARKRKADLRLDSEEGAFVDLGEGRKPFVARDLRKSEALRRILTTEASKRMPPPKATRQLSRREVALIQRWIEQGAKWQKHWAFIPPRRSPVPAISDRQRALNPIDNFILARLEQAGLQPSPVADRLRLLRRVTLDLTGLPPSLEEIAAFEKDTRPDAYERVVDRLLASPRYGERMAMRWLDAARYADTNGYQSDGERTMWRWRDWVIDAYNRNLPFDRFTIEQLAGDLLPNPGLDQILATGFNRNHRGNAEGGIIPEEYAVEYVADRVETTSTVWLGLTMTCARCHDHKYDPLSMREFYRMFAFFNNVPERGKAVKYGNSPPWVVSPTRHQQEQLARLDQRLQRACGKVKDLQPRLDEDQKRWEKSLSSGRALMPIVAKGQDAYFALDGDRGKLHVKEGDISFGEGKWGKAASFNGKGYLDAGDVGNFGFYDRFSLSAWIYPTGKKGGTLLSRGKDAPMDEGYSVILKDGRIQVNLVKRWLDDALRVESEERLPTDAWRHLVVVYDGSRVASGITVYVDGRPVKLRVGLDDLNQTFATKEPFRIGAGGGPQSRFHGRIHDVRIWSKALSAIDASVLAVPESVERIAAIPWTKRDPAQQEKIRRYYLSTAAPKELRAAHAHVAGLEEQRQQLIDTFPTTMVMQEMPQPRSTHLLRRGQYDQPGEKVQPGIPEVVAAWPREARPDRLGLARWLVDTSNPLTARVAVNRLWQMLYGQGIVKTVDDFGAQGEWPSHPELLDWLAVEFMESGWDTKHMLRRIVTSATYRQSGRVTEELLRVDPENRLLSRGPRMRLSAEMIRDQALAASGLLVEHLGGPSIKPYQPEGLWRELADMEYVRDSGQDLYRRGMYVFWKRTVAPPGLITFDAAGRETCTVRETRTNTPLQALNLLNDVTYVEAARMLAQRVLREAKTEDDRLTMAYRLVLGRSPREIERQVLRAGLSRHRRHYERHQDEADRLLRAGESPVNPKQNKAELAAYTTLASLILNLDEAITRE